MLGDNEIEKLMKENQRLLKENNKMLRKMRRDATIGFIFKILWLLILVGVPVWLYFTYMQPYVEDVMSAYQQLQEGTEKLQNLDEKIPEIPDWAKDYLNGEEKPETSVQ